MADTASAEVTIFGTLQKWGGSMMTFAQQSFNSLMGWEDLEVVDPEAEKAKKGEETEANGLLEQERKQAWGTRQFQQYIGADVTSLLSVPVWIMEPFTILQKAAEIMEYTDLLDNADTTADEFDRFAWVAAYCVSPFGAAERAWKPFNPILGETFELAVGDNVRYLAEQVSHHPPICAAHAENGHFRYDLVSAPTTRFLGNSLEVYPYGRTRISLVRSGEVFTLVPPNAMVHNIVIGRTWVDAYGPMTINCITTGAKCRLNFKPCGWFGYGRYQFEGFVYDKEGNKRVMLTGKWNQYVDAVRCDFSDAPLPGAEVRRLWTCTPKPVSDYYSFTHFAHKLNSSEGIRTPLPSDSRRRPDRSKLAAGEMGSAGSEKVRLEEMQRAERREREKRSDSWAPRWFRRVEQPELYEGELELSKVPFWEFTGDYLKLPEAEPGVASNINGKGFCPWQYPDMHERL
ncbi:oxysterol binding protein [Volvox carteri f. nagariensis]|uniref:Oxysterol binding protein n=1 Tax=Volvox carteri f. nagariensis TaxID=3068 RepID=D8UJP2_VOLCA|nr:oxysterol binding protein [Volvox carteri f. nagariensis]EFJ40057.1 oxysterol binding protein [Volvox carteri f. nagariensis]|eukprot:XP_002958869.1 oxysterol binding protein [Volvox carteri f. nagariensis]